MRFAVFKGHKYLILVYQVNAGARCLLWSGPERKAKTLFHFFNEFGPERSAQLRFVCSDMWSAYLTDKQAARMADLHKLNLSSIK